MRYPMKRRAISFSKLLFFTIFLAATSVAAEEPKSNPERTHAFELYQQGKMVEAMPLLEQLAADNPKDIAVVESWGVSILSYSQTVTDPVLRQKARARARSILVEAAALGDKSDLCETLLRMIPEDGTFPTYSDKKDVDSAMQQAESDFARGDIEKARQGSCAHIFSIPNSITQPSSLGIRTSNSNNRSMQVSGSRMPSRSILMWRLHTV